MFCFSSHHLKKLISAACHLDFFIFYFCHDPTFRPQVRIRTNSSNQEFCLSMQPKQPLGLRPCCGSSSSSSRVNPPLPRLKLLHLRLFWDKNMISQINMMFSSSVCVEAAVPGPHVRSAALMKRFPSCPRSEAEICHRKLPRLSPQNQPLFVQPLIFLCVWFTLQSLWMCVCQTEQLKSVFEVNKMSAAH